MYVSDAMREERKEKRREEMKNLYVTNERTDGRTMNYTHKESKEHRLIAGDSPPVHPETKVHERTQSPSLQSIYLSICVS